MVLKGMSQKFTEAQIWQQSWWVPRLVLETVFSCPGFLNTWDSAPATNALPSIRPPVTSADQSCRVTARPCSTNDLPYVAHRAYPKLQTPTHTHTPKWGKSASIYFKITIIDTTHIQFFLPKKKHAFCIIP